MRKRMVGGFNDIEEAVSVSAATSEAKQRASVSMSFQVLACGDETAGAIDVGQDMALARLEETPTGSQSSRAKADHRLQGHTRRGSRAPRGFTLETCYFHIMRFHPNRPTVSC